MLNFGCKRLSVVNPRHSPTHPLAYANAAGADEVLDQAVVTKTLAEAVSEADHIIGFTSAPREMVKKYAYLAPGICQGWTKESALVFGCERSGLNNEAIAQCHSMVQILTNPGFTSLNLAQAVLLACSTWFGAQHQKPAYWHTGISPWAQTKEMHAFLNDLEDRLDSVDYWKAAHKKNNMLRNLTNLFWRTPMTAQEIRTLRGMVDALVKSK